MNLEPLLSVKLDAQTKVSILKGFDIDVNVFKEQALLFLSNKVICEDVNYNVRKNVSRAGVVRPYDKNILISIRAKEMLNSIQSIDDLNVKLFFYAIEDLVEV